jgi:hypothetical protein
MACDPNKSEKSPRGTPGGTLHASEEPFLVFSSNPIDLERRSMGCPSMAISTSDLLGSIGGAQHAIKRRQLS